MGDTKRKYGKEDGNKDIAVTGTAIPLSATKIRFKKLTVRALDANVGNISIGGENITAANGDALYAGQSADFENGDLSYIYINGADTDGVRFSYEF